MTMDERVTCDDPATCERARAWSRCALDGELSELERALLDAHLARCADCARVRRATSASITSALRAAPLELLEPADRAARRGAARVGASARRGRGRRASSRRASAARSLCSALDGAGAVAATGSADLRAARMQRRPGELPRLPANSCGSRADAARRARPAAAASVTLLGSVTSRRRTVA